MKKKKLLLIVSVLSSIFFITNIKAIVCDYDHGSVNYKLTLNIGKESIQMYSCTATAYGMGANDCSDYKLSTEGYFSESCPTSIDVDGKSKTIVLKNSHDGGYTSKLDNSKITFCTDVNNYGSLEDAKSKCQIGTDDYACVWNDKYNFCNTDKLVYVRCGDAYDIPEQVPALLSFAVNLLKIITPIVLIIVGIITLLKALTASKEDEITKAKNSLVKKIIAAVLVFFVISIVQFVTLKVADDSEKDSITSCLKCFLNNECDSAYYKTNVGASHTGGWSAQDVEGGKYICTYLSDGSTEECN